MKKVEIMGKAKPSNKGDFALLKEAGIEKYEAYILTEEDVELLLQKELPTGATQMEIKEENGVLNRLVIGTKEKGLTLADLFNGPYVIHATWSAVNFLSEFREVAGKAQILLETMNALDPVRRGEGDSVESLKAMYKVLNDHGLNTGFCVDIVHVAQSIIYTFL